MAELNLSNFDAVLKEFYVDKYIEQINQQTDLLDDFTKNNDKSLSADGRRVVYPLHIGRNEGVGATSEGGTLPDAGFQVHVDVQIPYRYNYGRIQLTSQTIKQSMTSKGAFKKAMDIEIKDGARDVANNRNRQLWGFGTGTLALVNEPGAAANKTTIAVDTPYGMATTQPAVSVNGARLIRAAQNGVGGMLIAFADPITLTITAVRRVTAKTSTTITLDSAINVGAGATVADNSLIIRAVKPTILESSLNNEVMGLSGIIDDGSLVNILHGVNRTSFPIFTGNVLNLNGLLDLDFIQQAFDQAEERGAALITKMYAHHSVRREYLKLLQTFRRYTNEQAMSPDGGYKGAALTKDIEYADVVLHRERMCPYGKIYGIDKTYMVRYVNTEGEWIDDDGRILLRVADRDVFEGRFRLFDNFHSDRPNSNFRIDNITSTVNVTEVA